MSYATAQKTCRLLNLTKPESEYFLLMVNSTLTTQITEREQITKRMLQLQRNRNQKDIEPKLYELYENWHQIVLREILNLQQTPQTIEFLSQFFEEKITENQIKESLQKLNQLDLIEKKNGRWVNKQTHLKTGDFISNTYILLFHKKMIELAEKSLDRHTAKQRYLSALTLPIGEASEQKIRELIEDFKLKALEISEDSTESDRIMQLNLQFFPVTKVYNEKK